MNTHSSLSTMAVPSAGVSRIGGRPMSHPGHPSAIGFGSAIGVVTTTTVVGAALITMAPATVLVPIVTLLGAGLITSALVALGVRTLWVGRRNRSG